MSKYIGNEGTQMELVRSEMPLSISDLNYAKQAALFEGVDLAVEDVEEVFERLIDIMAHYKKRILMLDPETADNTIVPISQAELRILQVMYKLRQSIDQLRDNIEVKDNG